VRPVAAHPAREVFQKVGVKGVTAGFASDSIISVEVGDDYVGRGGARGLKDLESRSAHSASSQVKNSLRPLTGII
jgi:hypothetical protein